MRETGGRLHSLIGVTRHFASSSGVALIFSTRVSGRPRFLDLDLDLGLLDMMLGLDLRGRYL